MERLPDSGAALGWRRWKRSRCAACSGRVARWWHTDEGAPPLGQQRRLRGTGHDGKPPPAQPCLDRLQEAPGKRVERERNEGAGENEIPPLGGKQPESDPHLGEDERELADLRETDGNGETGSERSAQEPDDRQGDHRLADDDDGGDDENAIDVVDQEDRI